MTGPMGWPEWNRRAELLLERWHEVVAQRDELALAVLDQTGEWASENESLWEIAERCDDDVQDWARSALADCEVVDIAMKAHLVWRPDLDL